MHPARESSSGSAITACRDPSTVRPIRPSRPTRGIETSVLSGYGAMATPQGRSPAGIFVITFMVSKSTTETSFEGPLAV